MGAPKMSRRQRDHIIAKKRYRDMVDMARDRNPKLMGENPERWKVQDAFIFGYLAAADEAEKVALKAHKLIHRTHASTQEGHEQLQNALETLERLMQEVDKRTPVDQLEKFE
jgi:hypothetical protein